MDVWYTGGCFEKPAGQLVIFQIQFFSPISMPLTREIVGRRVLFSNAHVIRSPFFKFELEKRAPITRLQSAVQYFSRRGHGAICFLEALCAWFPAQVNTPTEPIIAVLTERQSERAVPNVSS